jgi:hypothetical protein
MKLSHIASAAGFALMATIGVASAQTATPTTNFVTITNQSTTTVPTAGASGVTIGTFQLNATQAGNAGNVAISSLPVTLTTSNGASASNLSSCQVFNASGTAISTGSNTISSPQSGSNTITFDSPLTLSGGSSATFTVRCNVASGTPSGGTFQFSVGTPVFSPSLLVNLNATPVVRPGAQDTLLALVTLSAARSGSPVQISSLPVSVAFGGGASAGSVTDCRARNVANLSAPLNNLSGNIIGITEGQNVIPFDGPLTIPAGSTVTLAFTCDVASTAPSGGTVLLSLTPSSIAATVVGSSTTVTPATGFTSTGTTGAVSGSVLISSTASTDDSGPTIPGAPNTGLGGDAGTDLLVLGLSALAIAFGVILLRRRTV